ncbi:alpha/beta hydrolase [Pseudoalteromonas obscura]|uniref:Alpha/beta hydrolase n=1 Tax=Pseudoalteromonas obscura TaxID=3048491 RepID=A0ABT7EJ14_9GAMM|nr:alpha/beta hydrolase [Pseudoalteromonas sp. P94(2023)]MDK2595051.1 alpha/beta hydrolase [Pseudoalteromonas sp. P94(2023)]
MTRNKVYVLPGTMCNRRLWEALSCELDHQIELVHCEIPDAENLDELCEKLFNSIVVDLVRSNQAPNTPFNLLGFSMGGYLAAYIASKHPHQVKRLFVVANSPTQLLADELLSRQAVLSFIEGNGYGGISVKKAHGLIDRASELGSASIVDTIQLMDRELGEIALINQYRCTNERINLLPQLLTLNIPIYFYYSKEDKLINHRWYQKLDQTHLNEHVYKACGSGHMLPLEKPKELAALVNSWLTYPVDDYIMS